MTNFVSETWATYCGVATSVVVLNSLPLPKKPKIGPFSYFDQENIFDPDVTEKTVPKMQVQTNGLSLSQCGMLMEAWGAKVNVVHARLSNETMFRNKVKEVFGIGNGVYMIVNYRRGAIGQADSAHFSPLGAYNEEEDLVLILDVARYKYPPVWVPVPIIFHGMNTVWNSNTGESRGYIVVSSTGTSKYDSEDNTTMFFMAVLGLLGVLLFGVLCGSVGMGFYCKRKYSKYEGQIPLVKGDY